MQARGKLAYLLAALLIVQVFFVPAFAASESDAEVSYNLEAGEVSIAVSGFGANAMISLMGYYDNELDYLNQYAADAEGSLDITYPSSAEWAQGGVIKVQIGEAGLDGPILRTVTISTDKPYIKNYTDRLTKDYAANILVEIGNPEEGLTAEVMANGKAYSASFNAGDSALIKIPEKIQDSALSLSLKKGDELLGTKPIIVNDLPEDVWSMTLQPDGEGFRVIFAAKIAPSLNGYAATINGKKAAIAQNADNAIYCEETALEAGDEVRISGVKFPEYFPSYSFTFAKKYA